MYIYIYIYIYIYNIYITYIYKKTFYKKISLKNPKTLRKISRPQMSELQFLKTLIFSRVL